VWNRGKDFIFGLADFWQRAGFQIAAEALVSRKQRVIRTKKRGEHIPKLSALLAAP
jgi:hypothetical protein